MGDKVWRMLLTLVKMISLIPFSLEMFYVIKNGLPWWCGTLVCVTYFFAFVWGVMEAIDTEED